MPIKFYTDAHIETAITVQLRIRGVDIIRCQDVGLTNGSDEMHLEYAISQNRSIVTKDRDFVAFHVQYLQVGKFHAGIFVISRNQVSIGAVVTELEAWHQLTQDDENILKNDVYNQLYFVP